MYSDDDDDKDIDTYYLYLKRQYDLATHMEKEDDDR